jgi:hypothetical protein
MLIIFTQPSWAEDKTCTTSGCTYQVPLDRTGFYIAVVTLPSGQPEGVWSLLMNPGRRQPYYGGGFFAGGTLKEHSQFGSWIGFSLAEGERVRIKPTNYTDNQAPLQMRLEKEIPDSGRALVQDWALKTPGQTFTTQTLDPGFYVISVLSQPETLKDTFFGLDLGAPSIYGGVVGGWLDSQPGSAGYGAFYLDSPRTMDFQLMFDGDYGTGGAGQPYLAIYYQKEDGTREVYWSAPQDSIGEVIEPTIPVVLPEPAVLPPDPGDAGKTTLEGIDSDKDGVRDDVQRYIALTYPAPEDKPLRAALREYAAFQQPFLMETDDKFKTIANAENRAKQIDCVLYLRPDDGQAGLVNLRAEYLNTESRTRTYLNADGQLGGQPISLTPVEDLPQLCQKFSTRSASAMTRSATPSASSCKKNTGTVISLSNGAMTDAESTQRELTRLRTHVESAKASSALGAEKLSYLATYNSTKSWINRLLNLVLPKLDEESPNNTSKFWRWLGRTEQPPQVFIDASLSGANNSDFVVPQELQSHVGTYRTFVDEGRKVVAVAHAEGNLYVNQAYESLDEEIALRARKNSFGVVSIASSASAGGSCAMAVAGSAVAMAGSGCTNLQTDAVIGATSMASSSVSISNSVVHTLPGFVPDPLDHSFLSYLEGDISGPKIINDVITAIPKLTPSPLVNSETGKTISQGVITIRLEWGKQTDVDLHVYEPNGSHVYYGDKDGIGQLDNDYQNGEKPEHYYVGCEALKPGLYKVAVNYFRGTGPETARINISAGGIIRSYTVPLASANSGASPIPVATIKVTQDEQSGEFKFEILSQKTPEQGTTSSKPSSSGNTQPSVSENPQPSTSENPQQPSTSGENQSATPNGSQSTTPAEPATGQKIPELIVTRVTDPTTKLAILTTTKEKRELIAIHGDKNSQGNLTSITDITYASKDDPSKSVNLHLGDDVTTPKLTMEFPDGKKVKVKNYDSVKKTANITVVETDEGGNETIVADLGQQPISELPQQSSCFDQPGDFGKVLHDCVINKFVRPMINRIMGTFCKLSENIASGGGLNRFSGMIVKLSTGIANFASQMSGETGSFCKPFEDAPELEGVPPITCYTNPVNKNLAFGKDLEICLTDFIACTSKLPINLFKSTFDFLGSLSEMTGPECSSPAPASTGSCDVFNDKLSGFQKWCILQGGQPDHLLAGSCLECSVSYGGKAIVGEEKYLKFVKECESFGGKSVSGQLDVPVACVLTP